MSCNQNNTEYKLEHELRVTAENRAQAIAKAMNSVKENSDNTKVEGCSWMATKLP